MSNSSTTTDSNLKGLLDGVIAEDWVRRRRDDRALTITAKGHQRLADLGIEI